MGSIVGKLLLQVVLIGLNAFFAATEIAVVSLNATKLKKMEEEGDKRAKRLLKMVETPSAFLSTIQIAITLSGFLGSAFAADSFAGYIVDGVYGLGLTMIPEGVMNSIATVLTTIILSYFSLVFGELVPKRIAMQKSFQVACFTSGVVNAVATVMRPVIWLLSVSTNGMLKLLRLKVEAEEETVTEEEIRMMIDLGGQKGTIDQEEQEWIENVFRFDDISVREAMTRTADVVAFSLDATAEEIIHTIRETGLSRYPVYDEDINDIVGTLNARDFLLERGAEHPRSLKELLRTPYFVPESIHADDLFRDMQTKKIHIAIVIDEYGQTAGIITIEDLLEENPYNLSKGQRQQVAVAAILCTKPDVLIVDEPTTGQDPLQSRAMMDMMKWLNQEAHKTIVVITHDMSIAAEYSDRIVAMHMGKIIADGTPREVFAQEELLNSSNLEAPQITRLLQRVGIQEPTVIDVGEAFQLLSQVQF